MKECPKCGEKVDEKSKYCPNCGEKLIKDEEELSISWFLFSFKGRIGQKEYLWFLAVEFITSLIVLIIITSLKMTPEESQKFLTLAGLIFLYPILATTVKRAHDFDYPGFYALIVFIPYLNFPLRVITAFIKGNPKENKYGPPPKKKI